MKPDLAVIPAAGKGTRMRPASRVVPKALLCVVDRPAIQYGVEEAARAGATEVIIVSDEDAALDIERHFTDEGVLPGLEDVKITVIVQTEALGLGHAVLAAREAVADRPFFCLLADNIVLPGTQILDTLAAASDGRSVVALRTLTDYYLDKYGVVIAGDWRDARSMEVLGAVEKPGKEAAPSTLGLIGRYLFTPEIFDDLAGAEPGVGGEYQLTDAIDSLGRRARCLGAIAESDLLDVGNPQDLLQASTLLGIAHPELGGTYQAFIRSLDP